MALVTLTTRIDPIDKERFEYFCAAIGMNCSTAVNVLIKHVLRETRMPELHFADIPNAETIQAMRETEELLNNPDAKKYNSPDELFKELGI